MFWPNLFHVILAWLIFNELLVICLLRKVRPIRSPDCEADDAD